MDIDSEGDPFRSVSPDTIQVTQRGTKRRNSFEEAIQGIRTTQNAQFETPTAIRNQRTQTNAETVKEAILGARDLILKASTTTDDREEQSRLLDLLEIFREYTEKGKVRQTASILATQIAGLENTAKQLRLNRSYAAAAATSTGVQNQQQGKNPTQPRNNQNQKGASSQQASQTYQSRQNRQSRLILTPKEKGKKIDPQGIRDAFNKALTTPGQPGPAIVAVATSRNDNIVVTLTENIEPEAILSRAHLLQPIIPIVSIEQDTTWFKVAVHGVPTSLEANQVKDEIETFNQHLGAKVIGYPAWLTPRERRETQRTGSIVIAFRTEEEARRAIRNRLYIAGASCRAEKLLLTARSTQCRRCQGFGHLARHCKKEEKCVRCGGNHNSRAHQCTACKDNCNCPPKCANCQRDHEANSKECEVYLTQRNTYNSSRLC
jgi:hypothetical protein